MTPKISIIVPVYNVEKYLERCIDSILNQTFTQFELILINDGSTDNSGKICDMYAGKDNRIRVIHKQNEGVANARNLGIDISKGEFIGFVDSDDYIEKDMYSTLYDLIISYSADFSGCGHTTITKDGIKKKSTNRLAFTKRIDTLKLFYNMDMFKWSCCDKLFRKESIGNIRFREISYGEDTLFLLNFINNNNKFVAIESPKYNYFKINTNSVTSLNFSEKKLDLLIYLKELQIVLNNNNIIELSKKAEAQYYERVLSYAAKSKKYKINNSEYHYKRLYKEIKSNWKKIIKNEYINIIYKMNFILFIIFPKVITPINGYLLELKNSYD